VIYYIYFENFTIINLWKSLWRVPVSEGGEWTKWFFTRNGKDSRDNNKRSQAIQRDIKNAVEFQIQNVLHPKS
jgi:hypothetical protein